MERRSSLAESFLWAAGIEDTFIPQERPGLRSLDEYELTQHYQQYRGDMALLEAAGARAARWGIPWYRVQPAPARWDWAWTDAALEEMVAKRGITPILDLMHYGTPTWMEDSFLDPDYPERVAEYTAQVCQRYGALVRWYTPFNEPMVAAEWCGEKGQWPPYRNGEDGYVQVALAVARGMVRITQTLHEQQPDCLTVQVEALWQNTTDEPALADATAHSNARQWVCFDLSTGRVDETYPLLPWLRAHGLRDRDLEWFRDQAVQYDVFGVNFYPWSYNQVSPGAGGGPERRPYHANGGSIAIAIQNAYQRYHMPLMVTETSTAQGLQAREQWMDESIAAVFDLRRQGIPVIGYTWFPVFTMINWDYRAGHEPLDAYLLHLGLYDSAFDERGILQRHPTPLVDRYRRHTQRPVPPIADIAAQ
jgi:beta-glucosidase/6-phospho-beta-glucosidase/beta-galactosidase